MNLTVVLVRESHAEADHPPQTHTATAIATTPEGASTQNISTGRAKLGALSVEKVVSQGKAIEGVNPMLGSSWSMLAALHMGRSTRRLDSSAGSSADIAKALRMPLL